MKYFFASFYDLNASVANYSFLTIRENLSFIKNVSVSGSFCLKESWFPYQQLLVLLRSLCAPNFYSQKFMFVNRKYFCHRCNSQNFQFAKVSAIKV